MVWAFDPRKLIEEAKENEKKKVKEVLSEQEEYDKIVEKEQAKAEIIKAKEEKKGKVAEAFDLAQDAINEVNYYKKYGFKKYIEEKYKEDPEHPVFESPTKKIKKIKEQFSDVGAAFKGEFKGEAKAYTLAQTEDKERLVEKKKPSVFDVDVNDVGVTQAIMAALISGGIKVGAGFFQFGAMVKDAFAEEGIPIDESNLAKFNKVFEESYIGLIGKHSEEIARERAMGRLVELGEIGRASCRERV